MITISVQNHSTVTTDAAVQAMIPDLETQLNRDLSPTWGTDTCKLAWVPKTAAPAPDTWQLVFLDDSTQAGALAFHDLTPEGEPLSLVFCRTLMTDKASISVAASHELLEMSVDPTLNLSAQSPSGQFWAYEIADPCEDDRYAYKINNTLVSDFITPNWFAPQTPDGVLFSFKGNVRAAFSVLPGGYAQWFSTRHGWVQVTGHAAAKTAKANAARGSRRERRMRLFPA
jgi:hypothetical protein